MQNKRLFGNSHLTSSSLRLWFLILIVFLGFTLAEAPFSQNVQNGGEPSKKPSPSSSEPITPEKGVIHAKITIDGKRIKRGYKLEDSVVSIKKIDWTPPSGEPKREATMHQKDLTYIPHILPVLVNTTVYFTNEDNVLHNVHTYADVNPTFNQSMSKGMKPISATFDIPEVVKVKCDVHSEMLAYILVFEHPFFGKSNEKGVVELKDVPPGKYTLQAWHESFDTVEQEITVEKGKTTVVTFDFKTSRKSE